MTRTAAVLSFAVCLLAAAGMAPAFSAIDPAAFAFRPHPGALLPLDETLVNEQGRTVTLDRYFSDKPVVVVLEYLRCKSLCGLAVQNIVTALDALPVDAGRDFEMLAISIDPRDTPAELARAKQKYLAGYHHRGGSDGIHFLSGSAGAVRQIADAIGFPYRYDADIDQYIHPAGFILAGFRRQDQPLHFRDRRYCRRIARRACRRRPRPGANPTRPVISAVSHRGSAARPLHGAGNGGADDRQYLCGNGSDRDLRRDQAAASRLKRYGSVPLGSILASHRRR